MAQSKSKSVVYDRGVQRKLNAKLQKEVDKMGGVDKVVELAKKVGKQARWDASTSYVKLGDPGYDTPEKVAFHNANAKYRRICALMAMGNRQIWEVALLGEFRKMGLSQAQPAAHIKDRNEGRVERDADHIVAVRHRIQMSAELVEVMGWREEWLNTGCPTTLKTGGKTKG